MHLAFVGKCGLAAQVFPRVCLCSCQLLSSNQPTCSPCHGPNSCAGHDHGTLHKRFAGCQATNYWIRESRKIDQVMENVRRVAGRQESTGRMSQVCWSLFETVSLGAQVSFTQVTNRIAMSLSRTRLHLNGYLNPLAPKKLNIV